MQLMTATEETQESNSEKYTRKCHLFFYILILEKIIIGQISLPPQTKTKTTEMCSSETSSSPLFFFQINELFVCVLPSGMLVFSSPSRFGRDPQNSALFQTGGEHGCNQAYFG